MWSVLSWTSKLSTFFSSQVDDLMTFQTFNIVETPGCFAFNRNLIAMTARQHLHECTELCASINLPWFSGSAAFWNTALSTCSVTALFQLSSPQFLASFLPITVLVQDSIHWTSIVSPAEWKQQSAYSPGIETSQWFSITIENYRKLSKTIESYRIWYAQKHYIWAAHQSWNAMASTYVKGR